MILILSKRIFLFLLLAIMLAACANEEESTPAVQPTMTATTAVINAANTPVSTLIPSPQPTATMTPTPEPTPILPIITVTDQTLAEDGRLTIAQVNIAEAGWLVIHAQRDGQVEEVLGYTAVSPGINVDVPVTVDPLQASPSLVAMLHTDKGENGEFEFPGSDSPLQFESAVVSAGFDVEFLFDLPFITITDQKVEEDGLIHVDRVFSTGPGWLFIHTDDDGALGPVLGFAFVNQGLNDSLTVSIPWRESTTRLYAMLYEDNGRPNRLDEEEDLPVLLNGEPVVAPFKVALPPDVFVIDQPVTNGQVVIDRAVSNDPGWLVIYSDNEGTIDRIIGFSPLIDGVNELLVVDIVESLATTNLHILLHEDSEPGDDFNFPASDGPITFDGRLPAPFTFRTDPGNYIITKNQVLQTDDTNGTSSVMFRLAVVDVPAWAIIMNDEDGESGEIIGATWIPAGVNRDIMVEVEPENVTSILYGAIHLDAGTPEQFDYPDGPDVPFRYSGNVIQSPFTLLAPDGE